MRAGQARNYQPRHNGNARHWARSIGGMGIGRISSSIVAGMVILVTLWFVSLPFGLAELWWQHHWGLAPFDVAAVYRVSDDVALVSILGPLEAFRVAQIFQGENFNYTPLIAAARTRGLAVVTGLAGGCMLLYGSVLLLREARLAVAANFL